MAIEINYLWGHHISNSLTIGVGAGMLTTAWASACTSRRASCTSIWTCSCASRRAAFTGTIASTIASTCATGWSLRCFSDNRHVSEHDGSKNRECGLCRVFKEAATRLQFFGLVFFHDNSIMSYRPPKVGLRWIKEKAWKPVSVALSAFRGSRIAHWSRKSNAEASRCMIW